MVDVINLTLIVGVIVNYVSGCFSKWNIIVTVLKNDFIVYLTKWVLKFYKFLVGVIAISPYSIVTKPSQWRLMMKRSRWELYSLSFILFLSRSVLSTNNPKGCAIIVDGRGGDQRRKMTQCA